MRLLTGERDECDEETCVKEREEHSRQAEREAVGIFLHVQQHKSMFHTDESTNMEADETLLGLSKSQRRARQGYVSSLLMI